MAEQNTSAWQEVKESLGMFFKIIGYSTLAVAVVFGAGYVYFTYFN